MFLSVSPDVSVFVLLGDFCLGGSQFFVDAKQKRSSLRQWVGRGIYNTCEDVQGSSHENGVNI